MTLPSRVFSIVFISFFLGCMGAAQAGDRWRDSFIDDEDGKFDASEWLLDRKGFLPVPILITEPAVGFGGGIAIAFFRESIREATADRERTGHLTPPDIFGGAIAATENGTRFGGAGGMFTFRDDRWRYRGGAVAVHANLDFYGAGGQIDSGEEKLGYTLEGWASSQQVLRRLGDTNHFVALRWVYLDFESEFDSPLSPPILTEDDLAQRSSGLGVAWEFDARDNIFTPSRGWIAAVDSMFYAPGIGSEDTFQVYRAHVFAYVPFGKMFVLGARVDGRMARGEVPFYQLPFIDLRGIPVLRYQDDNVGVLEAELRWNVTPRWAAIGFLGAGRAWGETDFSDASDEVAGGVGGRYLIARRLGMYTGADVAWGPEDTAFYLQVGSAWR